MTRTTTAEIVGQALEGGYGVPAINIVNDLTLEAVLSTARGAALAANRPDLREDGPIHRGRCPVQHVAGDDTRYHGSGGVASRRLPGT